MLKKDDILVTMNKILDMRLSKAKDTLEEMRRNRDLETKSSMGDKHETSRSQVQMEMSKLNTQLEQYLKQKRAISQIDTDAQHQFVGFGSLVYTNTDLYFISIGLGIVEVSDQKIICISMASPIGQVIQNKVVGDKISFRGKEILINKIV